jgi:integrase
MVGDGRLICSRLGRRPENRIPDPAAVVFFVRDSITGVDAMATVTKDGDRCGYRVRFYCDGKRRELYIAGDTKKIEDLAKKVSSHCDELAKAKKNNVTPSPEAKAWAESTEGSLRESLVGWGLADPTDKKLTTDAGSLLDAFLTGYIDGRTDVKAVTRTNYKQTKRLLVEYFGERHPLRSITAADASRWQRWMMTREVKAATDTSPAETMAVASVSKHTKRAKTMFSEAVNDRLLKVSPFTSLKGGNESNSERHRFIDRATAMKVLDACPDADWRLIFSLARFGGLRCPSEVLGLRWTDVDWDAGRLRIQSPKTGLRFCPMFPELRLALQEADDMAGENAVYCVGRYRDSEANLRTQLGRIIHKAKVMPWPKPFVNLRSTRRTELQENFPDHVINAWLGHSGAVAAKHYLQVTDEHWERAGNFCPPTCPPITKENNPSLPITDSKKPRKNRAYDGSRLPLIVQKMTPTGIEPVLPP